MDQINFEAGNLVAPVIRWRFIVYTDGKNSNAEVSKDFVDKYGNQLGSAWFLSDPRNQISIVRFEKIGGIGYLTNGLNDLRRLYNLSHQAWILFNFVGFSFFKINILDEFGEIAYNVKLSSCRVPVNHAPLNFPVSQSTKKVDCVSILMSKYKVHSSELYLPKEIAPHLLRFAQFPWKLKGPSGREIECKILPTKNFMGGAKLGSGWRQFCMEHQLKEGDCCKFDLNEADQRVLKISIS